MFLRKKKIDGREYWYVAQSKRIGPKVIQENVMYVGPVSQFHTRDLAVEEWHRKAGALLRGGKRKVGTTKPKVEVTTLESRANVWRLICGHYEGAGRVNEQWIIDDVNKHVGKPLAKREIKWLIDRKILKRQYGLLCRQDCHNLNNPYDGRFDAFKELLNSPQFPNLDISAIEEQFPTRKEELLALRAFLIERSLHSRLSPTA